MGVTVVEIETLDLEAGVEIGELDQEETDGADYAEDTEDEQEYEEFALYQGFRLDHKTVYMLSYQNTIHVIG